jgi:hypothetical protein
MTKKSQIFSPGPATDNQNTVNIFEGERLITKDNHQLSKAT